MSGNPGPEKVIAQQCIAVRLRMLNRVVTNLYDEALRPLGLRASQLNILVVAAKKGVARPADVCGLLQLDVSTLSRNVERMKSKGWIAVVPDQDGRAQPFRLTAKGKKLLQKALPAWKIGQRKAQDLLGDDGVIALDKAVARLRSTSPN